jgi:hypothetical protein
VAAFTKVRFTDLAPMVLGQLPDRREEANRRLPQVTHRAEIGLVVGQGWPSRASCGLLNAVASRPAPGMLTGGDRNACTNDHERAGLKRRYALGLGGLPRLNPIQQAHQ